MNKNGLYQELTHFEVKIHRSSMQVMLVKIMPLLGAFLVVALLNTQVLPYTWLLNITAFLAAYYCFYQLQRFVVSKTSDATIPPTSITFSCQAAKQGYTNQCALAQCYCSSCSPAFVAPLSAKSRVSFVGVWLYWHQDSVSLNNDALNVNIANINEGNNLKTHANKLSSPLFIFRDSLSRQDFSRICYVIRHISQ